MWFPFVSLAILVVFMVKAVRDYKAQNGGYASFGEALIQSFGTALVSMVISIIFTYLLYNIIDPGLGDIMKESMIDRFESMEDLLGEEAVEEMIVALEEQDFSMGLSQIIQGSLTSSILSLILALIVSAITKKNDSGIGSLDGNV